MINSHCGQRLVSTLPHRKGHMLGYHEWRCLVCGRYFRQRIRKGNKPSDSVHFNIGFSQHADREPFCMTVAKLRDALARLPDDKQVRIVLDTDEKRVAAQVTEDGYVVERLVQVYDGDGSVQLQNFAQL